MLILIPILSYLIVFEATQVKKYVIFVKIYNAAKNWKFEISFKITVLYLLDQTWSL